MTVLSEARILHNDPHLFDVKNEVTNRLVDWVFSNLTKISSKEASDLCGLSVEELRSILADYRQDFRDVLEGKRKSIWFDRENKVVDKSSRRIQK